MAEYIDKTALIKEGWVLSRIYQQDAHTMVCESKKIEDIPAVDVAPVRHGRWQSWTQDRPPCKWYSCDYCGFHALSKSNYCPNCGAKMDKEVDE